MPKAPDRSAAIPYVAIEKHGLIGDRRSASLVAADGTLDWLCLPDYDGTIIFGALLDSSNGGHWRLGPARRAQGEQAYFEDTMVLQTSWQLEGGTLLLRDTMLWPEDHRLPENEHSRAVIRNLRCTHGMVCCSMDVKPAYNCSDEAAAFTQHSSGFTLGLRRLMLRLWANCDLEPDCARLSGEFQLQEGEEVWTVLELGAGVVDWSVEAARSALECTEQYWRNWISRFRLQTLEGNEVRRTAMTAHLLTYAPDGSAVAACTTSLPERIGGNWNADYRFSWVRDASLTMGMLARLGDSEETERYLQWLTKRHRGPGRPLQVLYEIHGGKQASQCKLGEVHGYRGSKPVRVGNHAWKQRQHGAFGFLADCTWIYLQEGGPWKEEYWKLIFRCANYVARNWSKLDNGIWELPKPQHYVHSKVMCWVMLDRAVKIAQKVKRAFDTKAWQAEGSRIHDEVMEKGWSDRLGAFRQHYDAENLDAAELLISVMEFLPGDHPRVLATIDRIVSSLTVDGFVYRFNPPETLGPRSLPLGEYEGAFFPCTFWLATAYAKAGELKKSKAILARAERFTGKLGLFAEAVDPRTGSFLGNTPLLFSHVEYVRAKLEIALAESQSAALHQAA